MEFSPAARKIPALYFYWLLEQTPDNGDSLGAIESFISFLLRPG
jgi:hypothetical protein